MSVEFVAFVLLFTILIGSWILYVDTKKILSELNSTTDKLRSQLLESREECNKLRKSLRMMQKRRYR